MMINFMNIFTSDYPKASSLGVSCAPIACTATLVVLNRSGAVMVWARPMTIFGLVPAA